MAIDLETIRWASTDELDPLSGLFNKYAPPVGTRNSGLKNGQTFPRQWLNYQFNSLYVAMVDIQAQATANNTQVEANRLKTLDNETDIGTNTTDIATLDTRVTDDIAAAKSAIESRIDLIDNVATGTQKLQDDVVSALDVRVTANSADITNIETSVVTAKSAHDEVHDVLDAKDIYLDDRIDGLSVRLDNIDGSGGYQDTTDGDVSVLEGRVTNVETLASSTANTEATNHTNQANQIAQINSEFLSRNTLVDSELETIDTKVDSLQGVIFNLMFKVGDIWTTKTEDHPANRFGFGTWQKVAGMMMVGYDETQPEFDTIGKTGGTITHNHDDDFRVSEHALTIAEMPAHTHNSTVEDTSGSGLDVSQAGTGGIEVVTSTTTKVVTSTSTGGGGTHRHELTGKTLHEPHLPPYMVVHMWERTA